MAQFRTTADLVDSVLRRCGETTTGTSDFEAQALDYLNQLHMTLITGGNEFEVDFDESWPWARAKRPLVLELQPALTTGTVTVTQGSEALTFSSAPVSSVRGWHLRVEGRDEVYSFASHVAAATAADLDAAFVGASGTYNFTAFKLDYELIPSYVVIDETNCKLDFTESGSTVLSATLTFGAYTPAQLATQVALQLNATGGTPAYGCSYDSLTRKFTVTSDLAGGAVFIIQGAATNSYRSAWDTLGFDFLLGVSAASQVSTYALGEILKLTEDAHLYGGMNEGKVSLLDPVKFSKDYPLWNTFGQLPQKFCIVGDKGNTLTVRLNTYPTELTRLEFPYTPVPRDLKDNTASVPLVPRQYMRVLEFGAAFYLALDKVDDRAQGYSTIAQATLRSMIANNRRQQERAGQNFGQIIARPEDIPPTQAGRLRYGYTADR